MSDKFKKINEIKDGRGLRKFIKEALNASAGKTTYDLLGSVEIPLKVSSAFSRSRNVLNENCRLCVLPKCKTGSRRSPISINILNPREFDTRAEYC